MSVNKSNKAFLGVCKHVGVHKRKIDRNMRKSKFKLAKVEKILKMSNLTRKQ